MSTLNHPAPSLAATQTVDMSQMTAGDVQETQIETQIEVQGANQMVIHRET